MILNILFIPITSLLNIHVYEVWLCWSSVIRDFMIPYFFIIFILFWTQQMNVTQYYNWNTVQSGIKHHNSFFQYTCSRQHWWKDKNSYIFIEAQSINFEKTCPLSSSDLLNKTDACDTLLFRYTVQHWWRDKNSKTVNIIALPHLNFWSTKKSFWHFIYVGADNGTVSTSGTW